MKGNVALLGAHGFGTWACVPITIPAFIVLPWAKHLTAQPQFPNLKVKNIKTFTWFCKS